MGLLGLALTLAVSGGIAMLEYQRRAEEAQSRVAAESHLLADHAARLMEGVGVTLETVSALSSTLDWDAIQSSAALHRQLLIVKAALPYVDHIALSDARGTLRATTFAFPAPSLNVSDDQNFKAARADGTGLLVGPPVIGRLTRMPTFVLSRRLEAPDGTFKGMISVSARLDYFATYWDERGLPRDAFVGLFREDHDSGYRPLATFRAGQPIGQAAGQGAGQAVEQAILGQGVGTGSGGKAYDFIRPVGDWPLLIEVAFPGEAIARGWRQWALWFCPIVGIAIGALALLTAIAWRQSVRDKQAHAALIAAHDALSAQMQSRRQAERQVLQMQKMEAIGQLTGGIAHDFNNFLTVILGNADVVLAKGGDRPRLLRAAQMIIAAAERGAELSHRLLAFARRQPLDPHVVDVGEVLRGLEKLLKQSVGEAVDLRVDPAPPGATALVDQVQLETAVVNLAINARDAMAGAGTLSIRTALAELEATDVADWGIEPGAYVVVAVTDTGTGMTDEVIARAFEPFFTTKPFGKGSGLGLSMIYGFARQSGGTVRIASRLGQGTTFSIFLPAAQGEPEATRHEASARPHEGRERILVVEDDEDVLALAASTLAEAGYAIATARSGPQALEELAAEPAYDLLFTDIVLPNGTDGAELARQARLRQPAIKVLFTSGYNESDALRSERAHTRIELISKPYRRADLATKIREVLDAEV
jgi:signal transduction histidine kinase